jgi:aspartate/methionine/tyrosine aminotransferase
MTNRINPNIVNAIDPPIDEANSWLVGRTFTDEKPLLNLAQAVPSYAPSKDLTNFMAERVKLFETAQYGPVSGNNNLKTELANHMNGIYGGSIYHDNILISAGCNQAFCLASMALAKAGDEMILTTPYYFNHQMWLEMQDIKTVHLDCDMNNKGLPEIDRARELISKKTKAIVLVSPNNPTGTRYPENLLEGFFELCQQTGIKLIIDETYKDFLIQQPPHKLFDFPNWGETLIQVYSFSKCFSLTGYRVGSVIAGKEVIKLVNKIMDTIAICAPKIAQDAALYGLQNLTSWVADKREKLARRSELFIKLFKENDLGFELVSSGAYFAYVRHLYKNKNDYDVAMELLDKENILSLPGTFFGPDQDRFLRLAYANITRKQIIEVVDRLNVSFNNPS